MAPKTPIVIVIGGPNGAGKSTVAPAIISRVFGRDIEFINADTIARGLSGLDPERQAFAAGRVMLRHIADLVKARQDFAFESTLASKTFAPFLRRLAESGYIVQLLYVWVRSPEIAIQRVHTRVLAGGHRVTEEVIRRRYRRSAMNLFQLYLPLAHSWEMIENSGSGEPTVFAASEGPAGLTIIRDPNAWSLLERIGNEQ